MDTNDITIAHQREAERMFAAAVFVAPEIAMRDCGWLEPSQILDERIRSYWGQIRDNNETVYKAAINAGIYTDLLKWQNKVVSVVAMSDYARAIVEDVYMTRVSQTLSEVARAVANREVDNVYGLLSDIGKTVPASGEDIPNAYDVYTEFYQSLDRPQRSIPTRLDPLDRATGGFEPQTLTLIAARPSMGKTSLSWQLAANIAAAGKRVLFFSVEMSRSELFARAACGAAEVSLRDLRSRKLAPEQMERVRVESGKLANLADNLYIEDDPTITSEGIWARVAKYKPAIYFVDHLALVDTSKRGKLNEVHRIGNIAWSGKQISKKFDCAAVYMNQLNRAVETRDVKRPILADLRDSGELEQNADNVMFIYRPDYYDDKVVGVSETEIIIAKFRSGARNGRINLMYNLLQQKFYGREE